MILALCHRLQLLITGKNNVELYGIAVDRVLRMSLTADPAAVDAGWRRENLGLATVPGTEPPGT